MPELQEQIQKYIQNVDENWNYITPKELHKRIKEGNTEDLFLLDIRKPENYQEGHIPGSTNIFWLDLFKQENLDKLPKDKTIVVICYVGHTASQTLALLELLGYKAVVLKFGMGISPVAEVPISGWTNMNFETTKEDMKFSSTNEAIQYLSDYTGKRVIIAASIKPNEDGKYIPPKGAQRAGKKAIEWKEKYPDEVKAMTPTGWRRARQLANGDALSLDVVKRMARFYRHKSNSKVDPKYKSTPWKDRGYVAWLGWGDDVGINWARRIVESLKNE
jgi:rhodanese-related sulfurtransferase